MKAAILLALLFVQVAADGPPRPEEFRYTRVLHSAEGQQPCAVLDGAVFTHAEPALRDVRLFKGTQEIPYAVTVSEPATAESEPARVMNLGMQGEHVVFDLEMPAHAYSEVMLDMQAKNFVATAKVFGGNSLTEMKTELGEFTIFNLEGQQLGASSALRLQETRFPYLHVVLESSRAGGTILKAADVAGAVVPPSREEQTIYSTVAERPKVTRRGRETVAEFELPMQVPVEQVEFVLNKEYAKNFSREVRVSAKAMDHPEGFSEDIAGEIMRVHVTRGGREIKESRLNVPVTLGANLQSAAKVEVAVANGDDQPLDISAVKLKMRQRKLCWERTEAESPTMFYGAGRKMSAPVYDYARLFSPDAKVAVARMDAEGLNPTFRWSAETKPLTEQYPWLLWVALVAMIGVLGSIAVRSAKRIPR